MKASRQQIEFNLRFSLNRHRNLPNVAPACVTGWQVYRSLRAFAACWLLVGAIGLAGCESTAPLEPAAPAIDSSAGDAASPLSPATPPRGAVRYAIVPGRSEFELQVFRGGSLARLGHNHVIASTQVEGDIWLASPITDSVVSARVSKDSLTVDEDARRARLGEDFAAAVPEDAKEGTRNNMLGEKLLDAAHYPDIRLETVRLDGELPHLTLHSLITVKDSAHPVVIMLRVQREGSRLIATGAQPIAHSALGLEPFSVMLGALKVEEEMQLRLSIVGERVNE